MARYIMCLEIYIIVLKVFSRRNWSSEFLEGIRGGSDGQALAASNFMVHSCLLVLIMRMYYFSKKTNNKKERKKNVCLFVCLFIWEWLPQMHSMTCIWKSETICWSYLSPFMWVLEVEFWSLGLASSALSHLAGPKNTILIKTRDVLLMGKYSRTNSLFKFFFLKQM